MISNQNVGVASRGLSRRRMASPPSVVFGEGVSFPDIAKHYGLTVYGEEVDQDGKPIFYPFSKMEPPALDRRVAATEPGTGKTHSLTIDLIRDQRKAGLSSWLREVATHTPSVRTIVATDPRGTLSSALRASLDEHGSHSATPPEGLITTFSRAQGGITIVVRTASEVSQ